MREFIGMFKDREQAGDLLADLLRKYRSQYRSDDPLVLALPRGGAIVGAAVARRLETTMDVWVTKKIGAPSNPEYAIGAIAEDGALWIDREAIEILRLGGDEVERAANLAFREIQRRAEVYRSGRVATPMKGRTVIIVDDGLATGWTMLAAVRSLRRLGAHRVVVAVPVASKRAAQLVRKEADDFQCVLIPKAFLSVGEWYRRFGAVDDSEVLSVLSASCPEKLVAERCPQCVKIPCGGMLLEATLNVPANLKGWIVFAHGSGSSRASPRNVFVASVLNGAGFATLMLDLLTEEESARREKVFDIALLAIRLERAIVWLKTLNEWKTGRKPIGYFGASTGAAAALRAAVGHEIFAVVSRGGRPDLAEASLERVRCPVLLIVGGADDAVIDLNRKACRSLPRAEMRIVPGATHLFEEPGALDEVARLAAEFFARALPLGRPSEEREAQL